jgi:hypothetical protein
MPIGNATWGDFTCDNASEMISNSQAVVGTTCLRTDSTFPHPGVLYECIGLPASDPLNWSTIEDLQQVGAGAIFAGDPKFGGFWDGVTPDDTALQAAIDDAALYNPRKNVMLPPTVCLRYGVHVWARVLIFGYNYNLPGIIPTVVKPYATATLTTGFCFNMATVDGINPDAGSPQLGIAWNCGIYGVFLNVTPDQANISLATFADTFIAADIHAYRHTQVFKKVRNQYIDNIEIRRVTCAIQHAGVTEYSIEITAGGGDCGIIENCNFPNGNGGTGEPAIKLSGGANWYISNIINGSIYWYQGFNSEISKYHAEYGQIVLENPNSIRISDPFIKPHPNDAYYPIEINATTGLFYGTYNVLLENYSRVYYLNQDLIPADVKLHYSASLQVINCREMINLSGTTPRPANGIKINTNADVAITAWNNNSHYLSQNGYIDGSQPFGFHNLTLAADFLGVNGTIARTASGGTPANALVNGNTYWYKAQYFADASGLYGQNQTGAEISQTANANNQIFGMPLGLGSCSKHGLVKVYRGDATNSYNKFVILNAMDAMYFFDTGGTGNGIVWSTRAANPVDTIVSLVGTFNVTPSGGLERSASTTQVQASSASPTLNVGLGNYITFTCPAGNVTWGAPTNITPAGDIVTIRILQDGVGSRTQTWNAAFKGAWPTAGGGANTVQIYQARSDGTNLIFLSASGWY